MKYRDIKLLLDDNKAEDAIAALNKLIEVNPTDAEAFFLRGKAYWRLGNRAGALTDYASASALDSESPAVFALEQAREIEAFFNPDLLNP